MSNSDYQLLFEAGKTLIEKSGLSIYRASRFVACEDKEAFDKYWQDGFDHRFGRYMAWVLFGVGAENLAKAACVCNGVKVGDRSTLGHYVAEHFGELCNNMGVSGSASEQLLMNGYECLRKIRNRDAHSYQENVRDADLPLVAQWFVPAFNILVGTLH